MRRHPWTDEDKGYNRYLEELYHKLADSVLRDPMASEIVLKFIREQYGAGLRSNKSQELLEERFDKFKAYMDGPDRKIK